MENFFQITMGDPSADGHGKSDTFLIGSNLTKNEVLKAYQAGTQLLETDLINDFCADYEDCILPHSFITKLEEFGLPDDIVDNLYEEEDDIGYSICHDEWVELFLFVCRLGNPIFEFKQIDNCIDIGGYGLYS